MVASTRCSSATWSWLCRTALLTTFLTFPAAAKASGPDGAARTDTTITVVGDVMPLSLNHGGSIGGSVGGDWEPEIAAEIARSDFAFANLEGVLSDEPLVARACGPTAAACHRFRMPARVAAALREVGIDAVSVANNHANDFHEAGRRSTLAALTAAGLAVAGGERLDGVADHATVIVERNGHRVGFAAFSPHMGTRSMHDLAAVASTIRELRRQTDHVVVSVHAGAEGQKAEHTPVGPEIYLGDRRGDVRSFSRTAIEAGASLVFGHGPHVPRGLEVHQGRLILYSLGNFWVGHGISVSEDAGVAPLVAVRLTEKGGLACAKILSVVSARPRSPRPDPEQRAVRRMLDLTASDFPESSGLFREDGTVSPDGRPCTVHADPVLGAD